MRGHSGCGCCCVNRAAELDWAASFSFPPLARGGGGRSHHTHSTGVALGPACVDALSSLLTTASVAQTSVLGSALKMVHT